MTPYVAVEKMVTHIEELIKSRKEAINSGNVASWEEYKYLAGVLRGLDLALDEIQKQASQME